MEPQKVKLGDVIDDYCTRCRLLMNHGVVGMVQKTVRKVRCLTCQFEHPYRHARLPKKRDTTRALYEKVRRSVQPERPASAHPPANPGPAPDDEKDDDTRPAATIPRQPVFRKPRSHSLAAQRGVQKGKPFTSRRGKDPRHGKDPRRGR